MSFQRLFLLATPALFVLIWSTGWIAARYAAPFADPLWYLTIRFFLAAVVLALFAVLMRARWPADATAWLHALVSGILLHGIYLAGMEIHWENGLNARGFTFKNPNASKTCGPVTSGTTVRVAVRLVTDDPTLATCTLKVAPLSAAMVGWMV